MFKKALSIFVVTGGCLLFSGCDQVHVSIKCTYDSGFGFADYRAEDWWPSYKAIYVNKSDSYSKVSWNASPDYKNHLATAGIGMGKYYDSEWYYHDECQEDDPYLNLYSKGGYSIMPVGGVW
ncbi:MAG: hypothetical protein AB1630_06480 [bacterium]